MGASRTHWVSRELLARAWAAEAGPDDAPLTIDLDSTICETYGLAKEGARHHGYIGARGYHPLLARAWTTVAGTGDVLMSRLREGRANAARRAAHPAFSPALALGGPVQWRPGPIVSHPTPGPTAPPSPEPLTGQPIVPANSRQPSPRVSSAASHTAIPSLAAIADCLQHSKWRLRPAPDLPSGSDADQTIAPARPSISVPLPYHPHSVDSG